MLKKLSAPKKQALLHGLTAILMLSMLLLNHLECNDSLLVQLVHKKKINDAYATHAFMLFSSIAETPSSKQLLHASREAQI